jgi:hypothetical protein
MVTTVHVFSVWSLAVSEARGGTTTYPHSGLKHMDDRDVQTGPVVSSVGVEVADDVLVFVKSIPRPKKMLKNPRGVKGLFERALEHTKKVAAEPG